MDATIDDFGRSEDEGRIERGDKRNKPVDVEVELTEKSRLE